jgi:hypothetical protein
MIAPSAQIKSLLRTVAVHQKPSDALLAMVERESEFATALEARLTGVALDPRARKIADEFLDADWSDETHQEQVLRAGSSGREVIIGSGFHAAVYAAIRVLSGHPRPLVLERSARAGGTFAMTATPTFYLNSRNRAGGAGLAGDQRASLNYLPGAPIQAANTSMLEYQTNTDMAFVVRLALAQFAQVVSNAAVTAVSQYAAGAQIGIEGRDPVLAGRVIDARGLGDPIADNHADGTVIVTFPQFMHRMAGRWPLRGARRVAVIGGGDSAKCAVESLLGIAPQPLMAAAALDSVDRVDWYSDNLPTTCEEWQQEVRGRYQAIGRHLRPDRFGVRQLTVISRRARPVALPGVGLVEGRAYDLVVVCTGNREVAIDGLEAASFYEYTISNGDVVARVDYALPAYRIGPHARLPFTQQELEDGIADIPANADSMFRTANKTAALAATLPPLPQD